MKGMKMSRSLVLWMQCNALMAHMWAGPDRGVNSSVLRRSRAAFKARFFLGPPARLCETHPILSVLIELLRQASCSPPQMEQRLLSYLIPMLAERSISLSLLACIVSVPHRVALSCLLVLRVSRSR